MGCQMGVRVAHVKADESGMVELPMASNFVGICQK